MVRFNCQCKCSDHAAYRRTLWCPMIHYVMITASSKRIPGIEKLTYVHGEVLVKSLIVQMTFIQGSIVCIELFRTWRYRYIDPVGEHEVFSLKLIKNLWRGRFGENWVLARFIFAKLICLVDLSGGVKYCSVWNTNMINIRLPGGQFCIWGVAYPFNNLVIYSQI
jgi:hypothetical protein